MPAEKNTGVRSPAEDEHHAVTDQHAGHAHGEHGVHIGMAQARDDTARHQGHVFRNGYPKAADQQHHEHGEVAVFGEDGHEELEDFHGGQT
jgi:hypothetical protein